MIFLDTSFLIGYLIKEDPHHKKALEIAARLNDEVFVTYDILKEFVTVVTYKSSSETATRFFALIDSNGFIKIARDQNDNFRETMMVFRALGKHKFSYVDCSLIAMAAELECTVLTFDKKLERALGNL